MVAFGLAVVPALIAAALAALLAWKEPALTLRRAVLTAALPVPTLIVLFCGWTYVRAATLPRERCGVDACGMAQMAATMGIIYALYAFASGGFVAMWVNRWWRRRR